MRRLRVGVVGVGYLGRFHASIYARMEDVDLVGVVDVDRDRAEKVASDCGCPALDGIDELIGRVDAVSIVVPTAAHLEVSEPFLQAGVHMLLEKPVAATLDEANRIVEIARAHGALLQIGHLERFNAGVMELAERVNSPRFIEVHRLGTFGGRATDVDVVTDLMIHDIDIAMLLVRSPITAVSAVGTPVVTEHVDIANARLEFANGAVANVTASRVSSKTFRRIRVFCQSSYHALNFTDQQIEVVRPGPQGPGDRYPRIVAEKIDVEHRPPLDAELAHFVSTVRDGGTPLVTGEDGIEALRVARRVSDTIHGNG